MPFLPAFSIMMNAAAFQSELAYDIIRKRNEKDELRNRRSIFVTGGIKLKTEPFIPSCTEGFTSEEN